jgi:hypothetical protein
MVQEIGGAGRRVAPLCRKWIGRGGLFRFGATISSCHAQGNHVSLLGPEECNNDSTNFGIFSGEGLKRLIRRTGWNILAYTTIGNTSNSTPADPQHDERAFCILESNIY